MNNDQHMVAWMTVALIGFVLWFVYKPWLKTTLFQSPNDPGKSFFSSGPGMIVYPFYEAAEAGGSVASNAGNIINGVTHPGGTIKTPGGNVVVPPV